VGAVTKPAFLIDVDGVLNPLRRPRPDAGFRRRHYLGFTVWLSPRHGRWLLGLADEFELVWATTWEQDANRYIGPTIGLPRLPVIEFTTGTLPATAAEHIWKLPDVARAMDDRPFVWADDDFTPADLAWAAGRTARGLPTLLLVCEPQTGLIEAHIDAARAWVAELPTVA
jgi:hypothetical protein